MFKDEIHVIISLILFARYVAYFLVAISRVNSSLTISRT